MARRTPLTQDKANVGFHLPLDRPAGTSRDLFREGSRSDIPLGGRGSCRCTEERVGDAVISGQDPFRSRGVDEVRVVYGPLWTSTDPRRDAGRS